uniref:Uncharacterized protein n=1 Tax=Globodera pallida TaxID=36090 RepID=A0A183BXW2_GLOPA
MNAFIMKEEKFRFDFDNVQLFKLAIAHFTGKSITYYKKYDEKSFWTSLDAICIIHLSNFMVNLLNGILNSPKLNTYFVHTDAIRINWNPYKKEMFKLIQVLKENCIKNVTKCTKFLYQREKIYFLA